MLSGPFCFYQVLLNLYWTKNTDYYCIYDVSHLDTLLSLT